MSLASGAAFGARRRYLSMSLGFAVPARSRHQGYDLPLGNERDAFVAKANDIAAEITWQMGRPIRHSP